MKTSIRSRMTVLVASTFAVILVISSLVFLNWFEGQLEAEVRSNDNTELDRQVEIIAALDQLAAQVDGFMTTESLLEPLGDDDFPVAIIPDDGTIISITNAEGLLLSDSTQSFRMLTSPEIQAEVNNPGDLAEAEIQQALSEASRLVPFLRSELSSEALAEYDLAIQLIEDVFTDEIPQDGDLEASAEFTLTMNELFFDFDDRNSSGAKRVITTSRETRILNVPITITATSNVDSIDAALGNVTRPLWIAVPVLVALAAALTYLATGRALQPVDAMTRQVEAITSARSGDRVPEPDTGDEINQLAVTMNGMLNRLETSAQGQRQFVSDVSHELRTPSAVIRAEIEAGLADADNDWPKTAESVLAEQVRLSHLVDDLLLLARMDEGGPIDVVDIDLDALLQQEAARGWAHPVDVRAVEPVRVRGESRQIERLVQNLVSNANRHATSMVHLALQVDGDHAVIRVDDDGAGVPAGDRGRVFDRFTRLDESRERDLGGSGLGLAIVREVAEAHGGSALITNSPLGGARVEIRLHRD